MTDILIDYLYTEIRGESDEKLAYAFAQNSLILNFREKLSNACELSIERKLQKIAEITDERKVLQTFTEYESFPYYAAGELWSPIGIYMMMGC